MSLYCAKTVALKCGINKRAGGARSDRDRRRRVGATINATGPDSIGPTAQYDTVVLGRHWPGGAEADAGARVMTGPAMNSTATTATIAALQTFSSGKTTLGSRRKVRNDFRVEMTATAVSGPPRGLH
jgi:hypothetical protein